jgi:hypothetical protein
MSVHRSLGPQRTTDHAGGSDMLTVAHTPAPLTSIFKTLTSCWRQKCTTSGRAGAQIADLARLKIVSTSVADRVQIGQSYGI